MAAEVKYPARVQIWSQPVIWKKDHAARGSFGAAYAGGREVLKIPVFIHPCSVCGAAYAPFGVNGIWYCREHQPK